MSSSRSQTIAAANDARNKGITLFSIGIGSSIDLKELKEIGNDKKNNLFIDPARCPTEKNLCILHLSVIIH
jgi:hypothetical protein